MRKLMTFILLAFSAVLYASSVTPDESFPDYAIAAVGRAVDESTRGRGDLDVEISEYSEDNETFSDMILASFTISYEGKSSTINAIGHDTEELSDAIGEEITSLLYYEELLLVPGLRLDYIHRGSYSFRVNTSWPV